MKRTWLTPEQLVKLHKSGELPEEYGVRKAFVLASKAPVGGDDSRVIRFTISTSEVDRDRDVIDAKGWDTKDYLENPVIQWAHDYSQPPIGRARSLKIGPDKMSAEVEFMGPDLSPFADSIFRMVKGGWINATSVGFKPEDWSYDEERKGVNFKKQSLLEVSVVPVPANPHALVEARSAGVDVEPLREWAEKTLERLGGDSPIHKALAELSQRLDRVYSFTEKLASRRKLEPPPQQEQQPPADDQPAELGKSDVAGGILEVAEVLEPLRAWAQRVAGEQQAPPQEPGKGWAGKNPGISEPPPGADPDDEERDEHGNLRKPKPKAKAKGCPMKGECRSGEGPGGACGMGEDCPMEEEKAAAALLTFAETLKKRGRVLSGANETKLRQAHERIGEVLAQVAVAPQVGDDGKAAPPAPAKPEGGGAAPVPAPVGGGADDKAALFDLDGVDLGDDDDVTAEDVAAAFRAVRGDLAAVAQQALNKARGRID